MARIIMILVNDPIEDQILGRPLNVRLMLHPKVEGALLKVALYRYVFWTSHALSDVFGTMNISSEDLIQRLQTFTCKRFQSIKIRLTYLFHKRICLRTLKVILLRLIPHIKVLFKPLFFFSDGWFLLHGGGG